MLKSQEQETSFVFPLWSKTYLFSKNPVKIGIYEKDTK